MLYTSLGGPRGPHPTVQSAWYQLHQRKATNHLDGYLDDYIKVE